MENGVAVESEVRKIVRPPIVVVMGHINHGKTKILDWYRKTKVVEQEAGGITQHIGAYEVEHQGRKITFIDTPGHEVFSKLRARGARVADIAILVVAADEGVKPQTKEALDIIRQENLPFVVAINKIDKVEANSERVKQQLAEIGILIESYGGKVPSVEISAKEGLNMDTLLEVVLLVSDLENFTADPRRSAEGTVIEAHRDPRRGITATLLVVEGTMKKGDVLLMGRLVDSVKIMEDFRGHTIESAGPSKPVLVAGLKEMPQTGDKFRVFSSKEEAEEFLKDFPPTDRLVQTEPPPVSESGGKPIFNLIIKADVTGSKEALEEALKKLESEKIGVNILRSETGDINESDLKLALATNLVTIVGFRVKIDTRARELMGQFGTWVVTGDVIYELIDEVKKKMEEMIPPEIKRIDIGKVKILKIFKKDRMKQIIGGRVEEGIIKKGAKADIKRFKEFAGEGTIAELQRERQSVREVSKGFECGIAFESETEVKEGDVLEVYEREVIKRTL